MPRIEAAESDKSFLKSLGFPVLSVHDTFTHFDFTLPGRRVLLIGPMGSGKTEFAAKVWKDAEVAKRKGEGVKQLTSTGVADRRNVFFIRSVLDKARFTDYPEDALAYRTGYVRCGGNIAYIANSFDLEAVIKANPTVGTYIIDEASFFDERLVYVVRNYSLENGVMFIFPSLVLNFRRDLFNNTARLLLDIATDVIPLTAYCEAQECLSSAFYTYRYYLVDNKECPALYFDPLIIVGGDKIKNNESEPNYASRCDKHHYLPGKEYTFFTLKPLGEQASLGNEKPLLEELRKLKEKSSDSLLALNLKARYKNEKDGEIYLNSLLPSFIAEKALCYLFVEQNVISEILLQQFASSLKLDTKYMEKVLAENKRPFSFEQPLLW